MARPAPGQIFLFEFPNYQGDCKTFSQKVYSIGDDTGSGSVVLGPNTTVTLFSENNLGGSSIKITADNADLSTQDWMDCVSSLHVHNGVGDGSQSYGQTQQYQQQNQYQQDPYQQQNQYNTGYNQSANVQVNAGGFMGQLDRIESEISADLSALNTDLGGGTSSNSVSSQSSYGSSSQYIQPASSSNNSSSYANNNYSNNSSQVSVGVQANASVASSTVISGTGNRKALLVGINYYNTQNELRGCQNDVDNMKQVLVTQLGFRDNNIIVMKDNKDGKSSNAQNYPNKNGLLAGLKWLVQGSKSGDHLIIHYSGHGGQTVDRSSDRPAGALDDCIYPCDWETNGSVEDVAMNDILVEHLTEGVHLTAIMDCCHSGTALDLPYLEQANTDDPRNHSGKLVNSKSDERQRKGRVILVSGCGDDQCSADAYINHTSQGALTHAFIEVMTRSNFNVTWLDLLYQLRKELNTDPSFVQTPQLSYNLADFDINSKVNF